MTKATAPQIVKELLRHPAAARVGRRFRRIALDLDGLDVAAEILPFQHIALGYDLFGELRLRSEA